MTESSEVVVVTIVSVLFFSGIIGLIAALSILRQQRNHRHRRQVSPIIVPAEFQPQDVRSTLSDIIPQAAETTPKPILIPEHYRIPIQPGTPDQVIINIEPLVGPTNEERNIQRLIEFFKRESQQSPAAKAG